MIAEHIIKAKKIMKQIEVLLACPTKVCHEKIEQQLLELDKTTSQIWIEFDREKK